MSSLDALMQEKAISKAHTGLVFVGWRTLWQASKTFCSQKTHFNLRELYGLTVTLFYQNLATIKTLSFSRIKFLS
jgi:hypothetical protein